MLDLAIQIVNYRTKRYLERCLTDVIRDLAGSGISYRILIADNNSGDDLSDLQARYRTGPVSFYFLSENRGFSTGHNFLAQQTESRFILILNPDIEFREPDTIRRLLNRLTEGARIAVVGPKLYSRQGPQWWDHAELYGFWAWFSERTGNSHWRNRDEPSPVAWVSGAFFLITREAFELAGGFDELFFLYKEEEDLCRRLRSRGWVVFYDPSVRVFHHGSVVAKKSEFFVASDRYFFEKHFRRKGPIYFGLIWFLSRLKHLIVKRFLYR